MSVRCQFCSGEIDYLTSHPVHSPSSLTVEQVSEFRREALDAACAAADAGSPSEERHHLDTVKLCDDAKLEIYHRNTTGRAVAAVARRLNLREIDRRFSSPGDVEPPPGWEERAVERAQHEGVL